MSDVAGGKGIDHPEVDNQNPLEPTVGEQLRFTEFSKQIEKLDREELLEIARMLAKQALVMQPSAIRYLAREAAQNLGAPPSIEKWMRSAEVVRSTLLGESENDSRSMG